MSNKMAEETIDQITDRIDNIDEEADSIIDKLKTPCLKDIVAGWEIREKVRSLIQVTDDILSTNLSNNGEYPDDMLKCNTHLISKLNTVDKALDSAIINLGHQLERRDKSNGDKN